MPTPDDDFSGTCGTLLQSPGTEPGVDIAKASTLGRPWKNTHLRLVYMQLCRIYVKRLYPQRLT